MVSVATDDGAEGNQGVVFAAKCHALQHERNFQRAGDVGDDHVGIAHAEALQFVNAG